MHIAAVVATLWILLLNGIVGYQLLDDGTPMSIGLIFASSLILFIGTGYIALDTGFSWTKFWDSTLTPPNRSYSLYTLYQLAPLVFLVVFFLLEAFLVLRILGEKKPMSKNRLSTQDLKIVNNVQQYTLVARLYSLRLVRYFNMSLASIFAMEHMAR